MCERDCSAAGLSMPPKQDGRRDQLVRARAAELAAAAEADLVRAAASSDEEWAPDAPVSTFDAVPVCPQHTAPATRMRPTHPSHLLLSAIRLCTGLVV